MRYGAVRQIVTITVNTTEHNVMPTNYSQLTLVENTKIIQSVYHIKIQYKNMSVSLKRPLNDFSIGTYQHSSVVVSLCLIVTALWHLRSDAVMNAEVMQSCLTHILN